jgi:uncharacterized protein (DUF433 family)
MTGRPFANEVGVTSQQVHEWGKLESCRSRPSLRGIPRLWFGLPVFAALVYPSKRCLIIWKGGDTLHEFLDHFPGVTRKMAIEALESAKESVLARLYSRA